MPGKILGIDIDGDSVTAVQVEGGLRGYSIKGFSRVMIEEAGGLDESLAALGEHMDLTAETSVSTFPGEQVSFRHIQLPFTDIKKIRQAISFTIETMVPFPIEELLVDFTIINQSEQSEILAVSVRRADISENLTLLQNNGIDPAVLDIRCVPLALCLLKQADEPDDGLLIEIGLAKGTMVLYQKRRISLLRTFPLKNGGLTQEIGEVPETGHGERKADEHVESCLRDFFADIQNTLHAYESQSQRIIEPEKVYITGSGSPYPKVEDLAEQFFEIPAQRINLVGHVGVQIDEDLAHGWNPGVMDNALACALRDSKQGLGFNLRRDEFEVKKRHFKFEKGLRRVAVFSIVILFFLAADFGVDHYFLKKRYGMLEKQITEIFRQTLPEINRVVDPVQQLRVKVNEIKKPAAGLPGINGSRKVIDLLRDVSRGISGSLDVKVNRIVIDPEAVQMSGETDSFNTVDNIKKGLEPSKYFSAVTISSANLDRSGNRVKFELKLKRVK